MSHMGMALQVSNEEQRHNTIYASTFWIFPGGQHDPHNMFYMSLKFCPIDKNWMNSTDFTQPLRFTKIIVHALNHENIKRPPHVPLQ